MLPNFTGKTIPNAAFGYMITAVTCPQFSTAILQRARLKNEGIKFAWRENQSLGFRAYCRPLGSNRQSVSLRGYVGGETAARHGDGESILRVHTTGFHALVAENALGVVADVKVVVNLNGLRDGCGSSPKALGMGAKRSMYSCIAGAVERSTGDARNSSTSRRLRRTRSESIFPSFPMLVRGDASAFARLIFLE